MNKILLGVLLLLVIGIGIIMSISSREQNIESKNTLGDSIETLEEVETNREDDESSEQDGGEQTMNGNDLATDSDLKIEDTTVGTGKEATAGKTITVHYRGKLTDGTVFDESYKRGQPFKFVLGAGMVIQGWEKGFAGMKEGGKRTLTIPASLGYGATGAGDVIPPNATLVFDVELLKVE